MGFGTYLKTDLYFSHKTFNMRREVEEELDKVKESIRLSKERIKQFALMTEPNKFCPKDNDPLWWVSNELEEILSALEEEMVDEFKLEMLLENWDDCHDENGLAIPDPNDKDGQSHSYLDGDYVNTIDTPSVQESLHEELFRK